MQAFKNSWAEVSPSLLHAINLKHQLQGFQDTDIQIQG